MKVLKEGTGKVPLTILTCCILHNVCLLRGDALENDESDDDHGDGGSAPLPPGLNANAQGRLVRQALTDFLANN